MSAPAPTSPRSEIVTQGLVKTFGARTVVDGVSLRVSAGEIVGLLGRNGAGRTTTVKSILGLVGRRTGSIMFNGTEITGMAPHHIARLGVGFCPEERGIF